MRALRDGALSASERREALEHLANCARCAERTTVNELRQRRVKTLLSCLEPDTLGDTLAPRLAWKRLEALRQRKDRETARSPIAGHRGAAWAAAALAMVVILTLTISPVRTLAADLLRMFRVQEIQFTPVNSDDLPDEETLKAVAPEIERMFDENLAIAMDGKPETVPEAAARERAGFAVRLPSAQQPVRYELTPPVHIAMNVDLERLRTLFAELGYEDVDLPGTLDRSTVRADFQGVLTAEYGSCGDESLSMDDCITFLQMPSPRVSVPDRLDVDQLAQVYLELLGLPKQEADRLSERIDWSTTLVLPFPHHVNLTHETVRIDGVKGTLIRSESGYRPAPEYLLTWVKDGIVYAVTGEGDHVRALDLVVTLK
jgi:hypothetical protein